MSAPGSLRDLWLSVEYGSATPIQIGAAMLWDLSPLHLSSDLEEALIAWQQHFDTHFALDRWPHWDTKDAEAWHIAEGHQLFLRLGEALPSVRLRFDIWAVDAASIEDDTAGVVPATAGTWVREPKRLQ